MLAIEFREMHQATRTFYVWPLTPMDSTIPRQRSPFIESHATLLSRPSPLVAQPRPRNRRAPLSASGDHSGGLRGRCSSRARLFTPNGLIARSYHRHAAYVASIVRQLKLIPYASVMQHRRTQLAAYSWYAFRVSWCAFRRQVCHGDARRLGKVFPLHALDIDRSR